ncbi:MAG: TIGR03668 family PPOX class F420-dependent oxidoreductase [Alphaproteobacteria bacterium]|nr:TIGR03668 family PPOX class F420-dependent oxidoreductase [Alphaproteobacteria bacterium]
MTPRQRRFLEKGRVGRLATTSPAGRPHVVPVCYALDGPAIWIALDEKPKTVAPRRLARVRNVMANPYAALVVDHYDHSDWSQLGWVMVRGEATLVSTGTAHTGAIAALRRRYRQYHDMRLEESLLICITPTRVTDWGRLD